MSDPTLRFSGRADVYTLYRPSYPAEIIGILERECGLTQDAAVADVGSGTGKLTQLFLRNGNRVFGIEPNAEMRALAEREFEGHALFESIAGRAEETTLPPRAVDLVVAGQAFHWFDPERARREFARILRPPGWVVLVWNVRQVDGTSFLKAYERFLKTHATDYVPERHGRAHDPTLRSFFGPAGFRVGTLGNRQILDLDGLKGRVFSSSYMPAAGGPGHRTVLQELERLFRDHEEDGAVRLEYETRVYYGTLPG